VKPLLLVVFLGIVLYLLRRTERERDEEPYAAAIAEWERMLGASW
jgi:cbb3-type cytochrome oxidase subunit 3